MARDSPRGLGRTLKGAPTPLREHVYRVTRIFAASQTTRHEREFGWFALTSRAPNPRLARYVTGPYLGWIEQTSRPVRRREIASTAIPLILNLGPRYVIRDARAPQVVHSRGSFIAGLADGCTFVDSATESCAIQVNFAPLDAYRVFGVPMASLANATVELEDLVGASAGELIARLHDASTWDERFDLLDAFLLDRLRCAASTVPEVDWMWTQIVQSHGRVAIGSFARATGRSHKYLISRFHEQVGLTPKMVARIVRFERVAERLRTASGVRSSELALDAGYCDQSHLLRDFTAFAGTTPTTYRAQVVPDGGVIDW